MSEDITETAQVDSERVHIAPDVVPGTVDDGWGGPTKIGEALAREERLRLLSQGERSRGRVQRTASEIAGGRRESRLFGISWRGWLAALILVTMCAMSLLGMEIHEPLKSAVLIAMGFYFGQRK